MTSLNEKLQQLETPSNLSLVLATVWIVTKVFLPKSRGPTLIGQYADSQSAYMEQNDIIESILLRTAEMVPTRFLIEAEKTYESDPKSFLELFHFLSNEEYFYHLAGSKDRGIWFLDSINSFQHLVDDFLNERSHYYRNGFYCIVYTGKERNRLQIIRTIFRRLFRIYVININVLVTVGQTVFVYTYFPFVYKRCHNVEPYFHGIIGPITNYTYSRPKFFPKKLLNMWRCRVLVTTWTKLPFIKINYNKTTGDLIALDGIEGRLMLLLAERMNFTIQITESSSERAGNGTETGAIKMLADGLTNITIAGLIYDQLRQEVAQPSYSYLHVPLIFVIPLGEGMTSFERLIRPFKYIIWSCLSSSILLGIFVIFFLKGLCSKAAQTFVFGHDNRIPFTNLLNVLFGGPIAGSLPRRNFARYLLGVWFLYTLVLRSAYLAQLFLILHDMRAQSELNSVNETLERNFTFYSYQIGKPILLGATKKPIRIEYLDGDEQILPNLLKSLGESKKSNIAITLLGHVARAYNQDPKNYHHRVNILSESIVNAPITFYMRKHSYLHYEMNELILNIMSAGLISRFEDLSLSHRDHIIRKSDDAAALSFYLLYGLFTVYFVLLVVCTLVFLLELWSTHSPLTRRVIDFFNF